MEQSIQEKINSHDLNELKQMEQILEEADSLSDDMNKQELQEFKQAVQDRIDYLLNK